MRRIIVRLHEDVKARIDEDSGMVELSIPTQEIPMELHREIERLIPDLMDRFYDLTVKQAVLDSIIR